jgi:NAD(P)-dependent dehydrogenase (short-subunit alcohol dehydrogenase family)
MSVNLEGVFLGTKHAISAMKAKQPSGGSIINISSAYGIVGHPNVSTYNASKGGVRLYTSLWPFIARKLVWVSESIRCIPALSGPRW